MLKPIEKMVLIVFACLFGLTTGAIQVNPAFAESSEKIPLVQRYEQYSGQVVTGFCNVKYDSQGNLHWEIKVSGLEPGTQGHFDMGHWSGDQDVKYTADEEGKAYSGKQIVLNNNVLQSLFSQFTKCHVRTSVDSHLDNPGIAVGQPNQGDPDETQIQNSTEVSPKKFPPGFAMGETMPADSAVIEPKTIAVEKRSFVFYSLDFVLGILKGNFINIDENENLISPQDKSFKNSKGLDKKPQKEKFSSNSVFGPPAPPTFKHQPVENSILPISPKVDSDPSIYITSPIENSKINGKIIIKADVNNYPDAIVIFYVDGLPIGTDFMEPYEMAHHTRDMTSGEHIIKVEISSADYFDTIIVIKESEPKADKENPSKPNQEKPENSSQKCNPGKQKKGLC